MNKLFLLLLVVLVLTGCRSTYDVILTNGKKIQNVSKPVLDESTGQFRFALPSGKQINMPQTRVRLIEPHGDSSELDPTSPTLKKR